MEYDAGAYGLLSELLQLLNYRQVSYCLNSCNS